MNKSIFFYSTTIVLILGLLFGCGGSNNQKPESGQNLEPILLPAQPRCEVERSASVLKNSLFAPSENMKYTALKLHELEEDHDHSQISEQAENMVKESVELMKSSAYLSSTYLDTLIIYSSESTVMSNALQAHNESMSKNAFESKIRDINRLTERINKYTSRKIRVESGACLTNKEFLENEIRLYYTTLNEGIKSIESSLSSHCNECISDEIGFYENFIKMFRESLIKAQTDEYKIVSRTLADIEHTLHELSNTHEKEEAHHTMETLDRQMSRFEDELLDITGRNEL